MVAARVRPSANKPAAKKPAKKTAGATPKAVGGTKAVAVAKAVSATKAVSKVAHKKAAVGAKTNSKVNAKKPKGRDKRMSDIAERVKDIVCEQMGTSRDKVTESTSFVNDLGADSLDTVELVMEFEEQFDINIPDEDAEKIQTVGDAVNYISKHAKK